MLLKEAKETALIISGAYEGKGGFASLSGNFDNMGMSWGIVQFNFGQNTVGPLFIDMRSKNSTLFNRCFSNDEDLSSLNKALNKGADEQMNWAINMQNKYNSRWKDIFNKLAEIREFQEIQIEHADKYIKAAIHIIRWMREVHPYVMEKVEFKTFAALVDLAIQQGGIDKVKDIIKAKSLSSPPDTQYAFAKLVIEERGSTASVRWRADCISRRLGILNKKATSYSHSGRVTKRDNSKFSLIKEVCMRIIVFLFLFFTCNNIVHAYECDEDYSKIEMNINNNDVTWCKSRFSMQDNYFFLKTSGLTYKIENSSFVTSVGDYFSNLKKNSELFCSRKKINFLNINEILFFTLYPSGNNETPYCYSLYLRYFDEKIHLVKDNSDVKISMLDFNSLGTINKDKQYLYSLPNSITRMYLVKGDKVRVLKREKDKKGDTWYFINYKGKKEINM
ncbi:hypothetical protein HYE53_00215, partial [Aggregatibacter actinomycetemcomitans]|uniref:hypothetical protein n=1 Tax=Aggregatibacter actinomycetemcomitans TaxID=714 RepID=UPI00197BB102